MCVRVCDTVAVADLLAVAICDIVWLAVTVCVIDWLAVTVCVSVCEGEALLAGLVDAKAPRDTDAVAVELLVGTVVDTADCVTLGDCVSVCV